MVRPTPTNGGYEQDFCSTPLAIGLFISASILVALCTQHSRKVPRKCTNNSSKGQKVSPRSPLPSAEKIINADASHKADDPLINPRKSDEAVESEDIGGGGLWQKTILMGEKCQPPEFSGVLFYDSYGNRVSELPRSPRAMRTAPGHYISSMQNI